MIQISLNMALSLDGKISSAKRESLRFVSHEDKLRMADLRSKADAVLIGKGTLLSDDCPILVRYPSLNAKPAPLNCVACNIIDFDLEKMRFFQDQHTKKVLFVPQGTDFSSPLADVVACGTDPESILFYLEAQGISHLLLEGGGTLNASFLELGLVTELFLTLCPLLIGGREAPTFFEGKGLEDLQWFALKESHTTKEGELLLHYVKR